MNDEQLRVALFLMRTRLLPLALLISVWGCSSHAAVKTVPPPAETPPPLQAPLPTGLFGTLEFRSTLKALPNWQRVMNEAGAQTRQMSSCNSDYESCSNAILSWQFILGEAEGKPRPDQLRLVNAYFNRWPYRLDIDIYQVPDYWATPLEFLRLSGDCEDYCITKYFALKELGVPPEDMRIVIVFDNIRNIGHAVLTVEFDEESFVLDNLSDLVFPDSMYQHYVPQYSVNELHRWAHIKPTNDGY